MVTGMTMETNTNNTPNNVNANSVSLTTPSPQSVGREFVRQYYTVLNQGPHLLHRFYSDDSSFVHGGVDKPGEVSSPVYGQDAINKKILSFNFKDCHAKIRQVDSMETIGKGVVIQVTGELSNNGQPMRRFLQSFVLAPQSPTKYYVRNDIFRYQDEIFIDDDEYSEAEKVEMEIEKTEIIQQSVSKTSSVKEEPINSINEKEFFENVNGNVHNDSIIPGEDKLVMNDEVVIEDKSVVELNSTNAFEDEEYVKNDEYVSGSTSPLPQQNELKTYANMVSKNPNSNFPPFPGTNFAPTVKTTTENAPNFTSPFARQSETSPVPPITSGQTFVPLNFNMSSGKPPSVTGNAQPQRENRTLRRNQPFNNRRNESREITPGRAFNDSDSADGDYVTKKQYPDENQVFVGNLPQNIIDEDLRNLFTRYGKILDVRINRQNQKMGTNTKTPNYGFVTFECPDIVQQILRQKPIYFDNHRFNVEEKRSQQGRGGQNYNMNNNRGPVGQSGGMGGRNNSMGNINTNRIQSGGSAGNQRNRANQQFNSSGNVGPRGMSGSGGAFTGGSAGGGGAGGGGGGFGATRNSSFNRQQR